MGHRPTHSMKWQMGTSEHPPSMKYQCISIELRAMGVAGTAPKVQGVGGLNSERCRPANWRPAAARGSPARGVANQHAADGTWWPRQSPDLSAKSSLYLCGRVPGRGDSGTRVDGKNKQVIEVKAWYRWGIRRQVDYERYRRERKAGIVLTWASCLYRPH